MSESGVQGWLKILLGGLGVAAFSFAAPIVWDKLSHRSLAPEYVDAAVRVENGTFLLLVRNGSDDNLDLVGAEITIVGVDEMSEDFGAYPEPSHVYEVDARSSADLLKLDGGLSVRLRIAQTIDAGAADQFGFKISGPIGARIPASGALSGTIIDSKGNVYPVKY
jgi:hypothetical protein